MGRKVNPIGFRLGIVSEVVRSDELRAAALRLAKRIADTRPLPRVRDMNDRIAETSVDRARWDAARAKAAGRAKHVKAPHCAIACVDAALDKPFDEGIQLEQRLFAEAEITVRGVPGESFLLLRAPAVLTEFKGPGLRVAKSEHDGQADYHVLPER